MSIYLTFSNVHFLVLDESTYNSKFETTIRCKAEERSPGHASIELLTEAF